MTSTLDVARVPASRIVCGVRPLAPTPTSSKVSSTRTSPSARSPGFYKVTLQAPIRVYLVDDSAVAQRALGQPLDGLEVVKVPVALDLGAVDEVLPLGEIARRIAAYVEERERPVRNPSGRG